MSGRLRLMLADDELLARQRLARLVSALPDTELLGAFEDAEQLLAAVKKSMPDVLLLDIQMPGLTGMDLAQLLPEPRPYLIFCTAHPQHAVEAFGVGAVDYLLKPVEAGRLQQAIDRARERLGHAARPSAVSPPALDRLAISTRQGVRLLDPADITHAVLEDELVTVFTAREKLLTDATLQELQDKLTPFGFERVHRRALLHLGRVTRLKPLETGGYLAELPGGATLEISRQSARELRKKLGLGRGGEDPEG